MAQLECGASLLVLVENALETLPSKLHHFTTAIAVIAFHNQKHILRTSTMMQDPQFNSIIRITSFVLNIFSNNWPFIEFQFPLYICQDLTGNSEVFFLQLNIYFMTTVIQMSSTTIMIENNSSQYIVQWSHSLSSQYTHRICTS